MQWEKKSAMICSKAVKKLRLNFLNMVFEDFYFQSAPKYLKESI